jgi:hypothetical protein
VWGDDGGCQGVKNTKVLVPLFREFQMSNYLRFSVEVLVDWVDNGGD